LGVSNIGGLTAQIHWSDDEKPFIFIIENLLSGIAMSNEVEVRLKDDIPCRETQIAQLNTFLNVTIVLVSLSRMSTYFM
jgi:hypothetical protein